MYSSNPTSQSHIPVSLLQGGGLQGNHASVVCLHFGSVPVAVVPNLPSHDLRDPSIKTLLL